MFDRDLSWAELVLHVLAHLESTAALPSSVYDATYVERARRALGDPSRRALGADLRTLSAQMPTHERLVELQPLLVLHPSIEAAVSASHRNLADLDTATGTPRPIRDFLLERCPVAAELLRCAALLEAEHFARWPLPDLTPVTVRLRGTVPVFWSVAPRLRPLPIRTLRALGRRGRAWPDAIWVGIPRSDGDPEEPSLEHVLWQAAHEATVLEVSERSDRERTGTSERQVEALAVALLSRRAARSPLRPGHARWLSSFGSEVQRWADDSTLADGDRQWLDGFALEPLEGTP